MLLVVATPAWLAASCLPDLAGGGVRTPLANPAFCIFPRATGEVSFEVRNQGPQLAISSTAAVFEDLDGDGILSATDNVLATVPLAPVPPCDRISVKIPLDVGLSFLGSPLRVALDSRDIVPELDESNNVIDALDDCRERSPIDFTMGERWRWFSPACRYVANAPLIGQTNDDDGDGFITAKDRPDVVFCETTSDLDDPVVVRILDGPSGTLNASITGKPYGLKIFESTNPAIADLDGDGAPEIVVRAYDAARTVYLAAFHVNGALLWATPIPSGNLFEVAGGVVIGDLGCDGVPEVFFGGALVDAAGTLKWASPFTGSPKTWTAGDASAEIADVDADGSEEIVSGGVAYRADGSILWQHRDSAGSGFVPPVFREGGHHCIAKAITGAGVTPQVFSGARDPASGSTVFFLLDGPTGVPLWGPVTPAGLNRLPGLLACGDLDGDGTSDAVSVVDTGDVVAISAGGSVLWRRSFPPAPLEAFTGGNASLFDFDGDRVTEVVVRGDSETLVLRASDGATLGTFPGTHPTSGSEYVTVADLDADGRADLLVSLGPKNGSKDCGVAAITNPSWWGARSIWADHDYHINDVEESGRIGNGDALSWCDHNTWRAQKALAPRLADVTVSFLRASLAGCPDVTLAARIGSAGGRPIPAGATVSFFDGASLLGTTATTRQLNAGSFEEVSITLPLPGGIGALNATVSTPVIQCDMTNDACGSLAVPACGNPCTATAVTAPVDFCPGQAVLLDASGSSASPCGVSLEYRFRFGVTLLRDWAADATYPWTAAIAGSFEADVRCPADTSCVASSSAPVTEKPDPTPADQGNVLLAVKLNSDVSLTFPSATAPSWRLYRDGDKTLLGSTSLSPDVAATAFTDLGAVPPPPALWFYRVKGLSPCSFTPGP